MCDRREEFGSSSHHPNKVEVRNREGRESVVRLCVPQWHPPLSLITSICDLGFLLDVPWWRDWGVGMHGSWSRVGCGMRGRNVNGNSTWEFRSWTVEQKSLEGGDIVPRTLDHHRPQKRGPVPMSEHIWVKYGKKKKKTKLGWKQWVKLWHSYSYFYPPPRIKAEKQLSITRTLMKPTSISGRPVPVSELWRRLWMMPEGMWAKACSSPRGSGLHGGGGAWEGLCALSCFSRVQLVATLWTVALQGSSVHGIL